MKSLERVLALVEDEVVGELALVLGDLGVGGDVVRVDHREVEPGLDAVVQEDRVEHRARAAGETPNDTFETPSEVLTPGQLLLERLIPSIVSIADGFHSSSPVVSVKVRTSKISSSGSSPCSSQT